MVAALGRNQLCGGGKNSDEAIETITTSPGKLSPYTHSTTQPTPNRRTNMLKPFLPLLHYPLGAICTLLRYPPRTPPPRPARHRNDVRPRASGRLQQQESLGGLRDLLRQRDSPAELSAYRLLPSSYLNDPDGMPPPGRSVFGVLTAPEPADFLTNTRCCRRADNASGIPKNHDSPTGRKPRRDSWDSFDAQPVPLARRVTIAAPCTLPMLPSCLAPGRPDRQGARR
jgi:hypothetical protein